MAGSGGKGNGEEHKSRTGSGLGPGSWLLERTDADVSCRRYSCDSAEPGLFQAGAGALRSGKRTGSLRQKGVLILGSGNMVHNLSRLVVKGNGLRDLNKPFGLGWAIEANELFKRLINENRHSELANYPSLGDAVRLAVPTPEHYLPMLYVLALKQENETVTYFNDQAIGGSLTMTSLIIDTELKNAQYAKQMSLGSN